MPQNRLVKRNCTRKGFLDPFHFMGIGRGMFEETVYDPRNGEPVNNNFADYIVATNKDIPNLECVFLDHPDAVLGEYGARGVGEIGLT